MGIYIKGMEMPDTCEDCPFYVEADEMLETVDWCYVLGRTLGRGTEKEIGGYDCPFIEIPPHGRLIDADALMADVRKNAESYFADDFAHEWVDRQPTIIPAEEGELDG